MRAKQEKQSSSMMFVWGSIRRIYVTVTTRVKEKYDVARSHVHLRWISHEKILSLVVDSHFKKEIHVWVEYIFQVHCQVCNFAHFDLHHPHHDTLKPSKICAQKRERSKEGDERIKVFFLKKCYAAAKKTLC